MIKRTIKRTVSKTLRRAKKTVKKSPRLKNYLKTIIHENIGGLGADKAALLRQINYMRWVQENYPDAATVTKQKAASEKFAYKPLISIITPVYNPDENFFKQCIESVQAQGYENWQLCLVDDASPSNETRKIIEQYAAEDERITYKFRKTNGHISAASNDALELAKGEFLALLDNDDILWPNALYEAVKALNQDKKIDFLYSDEDKIAASRHDHQLPFFKPDWNQAFLHSVNYITHFAILRTSVVKEAGGFRGEYNGAQDWDLFLRVTNITDRIYHIPTILYSWRISETSTASLTSAKPYVIEAQRSAIKEDLVRKGCADAIVKNGIVKDYWQVLYLPRDNPLVSIVIPTKDQLAVVKRCINSIYRKTSYKNFEIVLVDTGSTDRRVHTWYKELKRKHSSNLRIIDWPEQPFSYSRSCNEGARQAKGEYLMLLNNDTEVLQSNWIDVLLGDAQRDGVGAVGCKLYYPDKLHIQHAGIGIGFGGLAANSLSAVADNFMTPLQHLYANTRRESTAVTAACLMIKKSRFDEMGGFSETFRVTYNDVDLCLRLAAKGYKNIYDPNVALVHHESISVGMPEDAKNRDTKEFQEATRRFKKQWRAYIEHDPHLNPNIERRNAQFEVINML